MSQPVKVAVYLRMSTDKQEDSPDRQREQVYPHCQRNGYAVVDEYFDPGITGDEFVKRTHFQRLLRDARAGKFDGIIVDHKDRLSRQHPIDYIADVVRPLYQAGVWVESVAGGRIDWNSMGGLLVDHVQQHQAAGEPAGTAYRTLTELIKKARDGRGVGGPVPYAYVMTYETVMRDGLQRKVPLKYALGDPAKVEVVQWLFREYASGRRTLEQLRDELHRRAVPGPRGTEWWNKTTIARILGNRRYLGDWIYNRQHCGKWAIAEGGRVKTEGGKRKKACRIGEADWVVLPDWHPAIIDRETFALVQVRLQQNRERKTPHVGGGDFLLNQLLVCGRCGLFMWGFNECGERKYRCSGNMRFGASFCGCNTTRESQVLGAVVHKLQTDLLNSETIGVLRAELRRQAQQRQESGAADQLQSRLAALDKQIDQGHHNLTILPSDRLPGVVAKLRELEAERDRVAAELENVTNDKDVKDLEALIASAEAWLWNLREAVDQGEPAMVRGMLREFIARIVLDFQPRGRRSPLRGGTIYLRPDAGSLPVETLREGSHMHHGLAALRKYLEPRLNKVEER